MSFFKFVIFKRLGCWLRTISKCTTGCSRIYQTFCILPLRHSIQLLTGNSHNNHRNMIQYSHSEETSNKTPTVLILLRKPSDYIEKLHIERCKVHVIAGIRIVTGGTKPLKGHLLINQLRTRKCWDGRLCQVSLWFNMAWHDLSFFVLLICLF